MASGKVPSNYLEKAAPVLGEMHGSAAELQ